MNSAALIVLAVVGASAVWLLRGRPQLASAAGIVGLALSLLAVGLQRPGASLVVGGLAVVVTDFSRAALAVATASFLGLALLDVVSGGGYRGGGGVMRSPSGARAGGDGVMRSPSGARAGGNALLPPGPDRGASPPPVGGAELPATARAPTTPTGRRRTRSTAARAPAAASTSGPDSVPETSTDVAAPDTPMPRPVALEPAGTPGRLAGATSQRPTETGAWTAAPLGVPFLATLAFLAVGLPAADPAAYRYLPNAVGPEISLLLLTAAGILVLPTGLRGTEDLSSLRTSLRELRLIGLAGGLALVGAAWLVLLGTHAIPDPQASAAGIGLVGLAVVVRVGAVPLHAARARLGTALPTPLVAVAAAWLPAGFVLAALAWSRSALTPLGLAAPGEASAVLVAVAFVTLIAGSVAAALQEDLRRLVIYSVIGDGGLALLALVAGTSASAPAGRTWLVLYALGKSALVAWSMAMRRAYGTEVVDDLGGWARRAPLLAVGLLAIAVGTVGLPGWPAFEVRGRLIQNALDGAWPWTPLLTGAAWLGVLPYLRLAVVGLGAPASTVRSAAGEWPALRRDRAPAPSSNLPRGVPSGLVRPLEVLVESAPTLGASVALALGLLLCAAGAGGMLLAAAAGAG